MTNLRVMSLDTRTLRNQNGIWTAGKKKAVCNICAKIDACDLLKDHVTMCVEYMPVLGFSIFTGLDRDEFNTFRLGEAWFARLSQYEGKVAIVDAKKKTVMRLMTVTARYKGTLRKMLDDHSHYNHTMLDVDPKNTPAEFGKMILNWYGPHIAKIDRPATVINLKGIK